VLRNRLEKEVEVMGLIPENQAGFRKRSVEEKLITRRRYMNKQK